MPGENETDDIERGALVLISIAGALAVGLLLWHFEGARNLAKLLLAFWCLGAACKVVGLLTRRWFP